MNHRRLVAINNFCNIVTENNGIIPEQHMGPLLLMIGILTNNKDRITSTIDNYPDIDVENPINPYVIGIIYKLGLLPDDLCNSDENDINLDVP
tara:strand:- start:472 stop:750 length:279 start_codon:yes stop_codon:yes gene_type:complete